MTTKFNNDNFFETANTKRIPHSFLTPNMGVPRKT